MCKASYRTPLGLFISIEKNAQGEMILFKVEGTIHGSRAEIVWYIQDGREVFSPRKWSFVDSERDDGTGHWWSEPLNLDPHDFEELLSLPDQYPKRDMLLVYARLRKRKGRHLWGGATTYIPDPEEELESL